MKRSSAIACILSLWLSTQALTAQTLATPKALSARLAAGEGEAVLQEIEAGIRSPKLSFAHLKIGLEAALGLGSIRRARRLVDVAQTRFPDDPEVDTWYGHVYMAAVESLRESGRAGLFTNATLSDAANYYRSARKRGADPYLNASCEAEALAMAKNYKKALEVLEIALAARPGDRRATLFKARLLKETPRAEEAGPLLAQLYAKNEGDIEVARELLSALLPYQGPEEMRSLFLKLARRFPQDRDLYERFWSRYFQKPSSETNPRSAYLQNAGTSANSFLRSSFESRLKEDPSDRFAWWYLAYLDENQGRPAMALERYRRYQELDSGNAFGHLNIGRVLAKMGRLEESRAELFQANAQGGVPPEALADEMSRLVQKCWDARRWAMAIEVQRVVVSLRPTPREQLNLAAILFNSGESAEGLRGFRRILQQSDLADGERSLTENYLALALWGSGQKEQAIAALRRSLKADPEQLDPRENLGVFLLRLGQTEGARRALEAVLKRDPVRARARYHLMRLNFPSLL